MMTDILTQIVTHKQDTLDDIKIALHHAESLPNNGSLINSLQDKDGIGVIAEIKRGSPSKGLFAPDLDILKQAKLYETNQALAISVLTDSRYFYGGFNDLRSVVQTVTTPTLCKDFIIEACQLDYAKKCGASVVLLIVSALEEHRLEALYDYAKSIGLEVLVETHNKEELDMAIEIGAKLIGINNRNLKTFKTDIQVSLDLIKQIDKQDFFLVSESGIRTTEDILTLEAAGFDAVLVGETLVKSPEALNFNRKEQDHDQD